MKRSQLAGNWSRVLSPSDLECFNAFETKPDVPGQSTANFQFRLRGSGEPRKINERIAN